MNKGLIAFANSEFYKNQQQLNEINIDFKYSYGSPTSFIMNPKDYKRMRLHIIAKNKQTVKRMRYALCR